jgi:hypothetical protein
MKLTRRGQALLNTLIVIAALAALGFAGWIETGM